MIYRRAVHTFNEQVEDRDLINHAMLKLGWGEDLTRGIYKYLSNQAHSLAMAFRRTEANKVYEQGTVYPKVTTVLTALKQEYAPT